MRERPTAAQRRGRSPLILATAAEEGVGPSMLVHAQPHPRNEVALRSFTVKPAHVAACVRAGLAAGWRPFEPGPQFLLELQVSESSRILPRGGSSLGERELAALAAAPHRDRFGLSGGAGHGQPSGVEINGRDLLELVAEVEHPLVERELLLRREKGEELDANHNFAGEYVGLRASQYRSALRGGLPSGEVDEFSLPADDPRRPKTTLLTCTCGINERWFLLADIRVLDEVLVWSGFEQFHRRWVYDLGPFVSDKAAYLRALEPSSAEGRATAGHWLTAA